MIIRDDFKAIRMVNEMGRSIPVQSQIPCLEAGLTIPCFVIKRGLYATQAEYPHAE